MKEGQIFEADMVTKKKREGGFPGGSDGKESACSAGDSGSIPRSVRYPEKRMAIHSSILAWRIPWMEEPDRLQSMKSQSQTQLSD